MPQSLASLTILLEAEGLLERGTQGRKVTYTPSPTAAATAFPRRRRARATTGEPSRRAHARPARRPAARPGGPARPAGRDRAGVAVSQRRGWAPSSPPRWSGSGAVSLADGGRTCRRRLYSRPAETPTRAAARTLAYDDGAPFQPASHSERRRASYIRRCSRNTSNADPSSVPGL
jgi:hypothetical protein